MLTLGILVGVASFDRGDFDLAMATAITIWGLYAVGLLLRREGRIQARRFALLLVAGFALVAVALPLTHFAIMRLALVGVSHRQAPVELRERVAVGPADAAALAGELGRRLRGRGPLDLQPNGALSRSR